MNVKPFFAASSYDTPADYPRFLGDRMSLNTRWYFVGRYVREVFRSRAIALKGFYDRDAWAASSFRVFKSIEGCGGHFHIRGMDNLHSCREPVVFISNHMSTLETMVLPSIIAPHMEVTFVVKDTLTTHPLFGPVMRSRDPIVVKRKNPREDFQVVMTKGKEHLAKGTSLVIFPQSTRTVVFVPEEFNSLGIKVARASGVKVIPIALKTDFWGNGRYLKELGPLRRSLPIHIEFGSPFAVQGNGKEDHVRTVDFLREHLQKWNARIEG